jgi:hypothetical protein
MEHSYIKSKNKNVTVKNYLKFVSTRRFFLYKWCSRLQKCMHNIEAYISSFYFQIRLKDINEMQHTLVLLNNLIRYNYIFPRELSMSVYLFIIMSYLMSLRT